MIIMRRQNMRMARLKIHDLRVTMFITEIARVGR